MIYLDYMPIDSLPLAIMGVLIWGLVEVLKIGSENE